MVIKSEMTLFNVIIDDNYKLQLLNHLSNINNVHIKSKDDTPVKKVREDKDEIKANIKVIRNNLDNLLKKLKINEIEFKELRIKKDARTEFKASNLNELINLVSEEVDFYLNRFNELERYIIRASIKLENLKIIKSSYVFLESYHISRENYAALEFLEFKVFTTFTKNLPNLRNLFDISAFPNVFQTDENYPNIYQMEDRSIFFIFYPKEMENELRERINIIHAEEVPILKKYLTEEGINFTRINNELNIINNTVVKYEKEKKKLRTQNFTKFAAFHEIVQNIEEYNWVEHQFKDFKPNRVMIEFYVPRSDKKDVEQKLLNIFKEKIVFKSVDISKNKKTSEIKNKQPKVSSELSNDLKFIERSEEEDKGDLRVHAPTIMKNPWFIRPFESLTKLYGTPSYSEIDPTPFLAITFPLIFGLMFGDIGHGLVLIISGIIGGILFRKRKGDIRNYSWILFYCGIGAVFWGFFYGEFFGSNEIFGVPLEAIEFSLPLLGTVILHNPLNNILSIFMFTIFIGVLHLNFGWFVQFLNYWKQKQKYLAFTDSLMKIGLLSGGAILIFTYGLDIDAWLYQPPYPILLVIIPGILLIILKPFGRIFGISYLKHESIGSLMGEGTIETFETILSVLSNILSYIRLLALSLVHISLMLAINTMTDLIPEPVPITGGMEWGEILGIIGVHTIRIIGLVFGNMVVILLEGLLVFVNSMRLHFYEFFSKFYQGTGTEFFPFYLDDEFSVIIFRAEYGKDLISEEIEKEIEPEKVKKDIDEAIQVLENTFFK